MDETGLLTESESRKLLIINVRKGVKKGSRIIAYFLFLPASRRRLAWKQAPIKFKKQVNDIVVCVLNLLFPNGGRVAARPCLAILVPWPAGPAEPQQRRD
jgi:hypothetical protein